MASASDFTTSGKVLAIKEGSVVFAPQGTTYELLLKHSGDAPPVNEPVWALIRAQGRKVWTVPSGGNFLVPIMGPTKIVQGRVVYADDKELVLKAGANVIVELPRAEAAVDLPNGAIAVGVMVNATLLPGARVEFVGNAKPLLRRRTCGRLGRVMATPGRNDSSVD